MKFTLDDIKQSACAHLNQHLLEELEKPKKPAKYRNKKTEVNGIKFDSVKEAKRYKDLLLLLKIGEIGLLELQVPFLLIEANEKERKCEYIADFVYWNRKTGKKVVEDVKSKATRKLSTYVMKRKLLLERYGIEIKEI